MIVALLDGVSADSLRSSVETLAGFGTRHANSDTLSATAGIGAARRWLAGRLAAAAGGSLAVEYRSFEALRCGVTRTHRNVRARHEGTASPARAFVLSAHLDSRTLDGCDASAPAPGANDDASGVALLLESARLLATLDVEADLYFLATAAEELGLVGSTHAAASFALAGTRIDGFVTNDIVGAIEGCADPACPPGEPVIVDSTSVRHFSRGPSTTNHRQLTRAIALSAMRYVPDLAVTLVPAEDRPLRAGDHFPFADVGIAAARLTQANERGDGTGKNGHQHNGEDVVAHVNASYLARVTRLNVAAFASLALAPESPAAPEVTMLGPGDVEVSWPSVTTAPDLAGYRVAFRRTVGDSLFYSRIDDVGDAAGAIQTRVIGGLNETFAYHVSISAYDVDGNESVFSTEVLLDALVSAPDPSHATSGPMLRVEGAPDARHASIALTLPLDAHVRVDLVDASGRHVARLHDGMTRAGRHEVSWPDRRRARAGVYFLRLEVDGEPRASAKLVVVK